MRGSNGQNDPLALLFIPSDRGCRFFRIDSDKSIFSIRFGQIDIFRGKMIFSFFFSPSLLIQFLVWPVFGESIHQKILVIVGRPTKRLLSEWTNQMLALFLTMWRYPCGRYYCIGWKTEIAVWKKVPLKSAVVYSTTVSSVILVQEPIKMLFMTH